MVLVRLAYVADLPVPAELVKSIDLGTVPAAPAPLVTKPVAVELAPLPAAVPDSVEPVFVEPFASGPPAPVALARAGNTAPSMVAAEPEPSPKPLPAAPPSGPPLDPMPQNFAEMVALFEQHREALLVSHLRQHVHLISFEAGQIEFRRAVGAPENLANRLSQLLLEWTGKRWLIAHSNDPHAGEPTLEQQERARVSELESEVARHPLVRAVLDAFPGATIAAVRERFTTDQTASDEGNVDPGDDAANSEEDEP